MALDGREPDHGRDASSKNSNQFNFDFQTPANAALNLSDI